jgi:hypothetical protein
MMITMTPEVLHTYTLAINHMDPNPDIVTAERGSYARNDTATWFELNAHLYTAKEMAAHLQIQIQSVRQKASRLGVTLARQQPTQ